MTDEVRQEDREAAKGYGANGVAPQDFTDGLVDDHPLVEAFARHASPLRDRIAVLEGALETAAQRFEWLAVGGVKMTMGVCPTTGAKDARATLNGEKNDG